MTKRPHRSADGKYHIHGKSFKELFGSRQQVMNGTAYKTAGELTKSHLMMNKWGRIVSRKKHATAKKEKRLLKHGYTAKKGKFGSVKIGKKLRKSVKSRKVRRSRKVKGGYNTGNDEEDAGKDEEYVKRLNETGFKPSEDEEDQNQTQTQDPNQNQDTNQNQDIESDYEVEEEDRQLESDDESDNESDNELDNED